MQVLHHVQNLARVTALFKKAYLSLSQTCLPNRHIPHPPILPFGVSSRDRTSKTSFTSSCLLLTANPSLPPTNSNFPSAHARGSQSTRYKATPPLPPFFLLLFHILVFFWVGGPPARVRSPFSYSPANFLNPSSSSSSWKD